MLAIMQTAKELKINKAEERFEVGKEKVKA
jgi:hypothetical protein